MAGIFIPINLIMEAKISIPILIVLTQIQIFKLSDPFTRVSDSSLTIVSLSQCKLDINLQMGKELT